MTQDEIHLGLRFRNMDGRYTGTVSRVSRSRKGRLRRFWARWDNDPSGGEAEHMPEDAEYLTELA